MNTIKKIISVMAFFVLVFAFNMSQVNASAATITVSGGGEYKVGDTVTISVKINGGSEAIGYVQMELSGYSPVLSNASGNKIIITDTEITSAIGTYTYTFEAKEAGTVKISVVPREVYRLNPVEGESDAMSVSASSTTVTVAAPKTASANNSLKSLQINPGTLSPAFSGATLKYSATVPNSATKITVSATPTDSTAKVTSVSGNTNLAVGANTVKVVVTAENGATATYTVVVTREAAAPAKEETEEVKEPEKTEEETEEPAVTEEVLEVAFGTQLFHVYNEFSDSRIPEGFEKTTATYSGQEISAVKSTVGDLVLVYLVDENDENGAFYVYNPETNEFSEFVKATGTANSYYILSPGTSVAIPEGYTETTVKLGEKTVKAWQTDAEEKKDFFLVYAMNAEGEKGFYMYDSAEGTFQRFIVSASEEAASEEVSVPEDTKILEKQLGELNNKYADEVNMRLKGFSVLAIVAFLLFLANVNLLIKMKGMKDDYENPEQEEQEEESEKIELEAYGALDEMENPDEDSEDEDSDFFKADLEADDENSEFPEDRFEEELNEDQQENMFAEETDELEGQTEIFTDADADIDSGEELEEAYKKGGMPDIEAALNKFIVEEIAKDEPLIEEPAMERSASEAASSEKFVSEEPVSEEPVRNMSVEEYAKEETSKTEKSMGFKDKIKGSIMHKKAAKNKNVQNEDDDFSFEFVDLDEDN
ncbi:cadherin-like beta sandwich domain-containing protein [Anaerobium acetethylicum]|uniref:Cadherin-like beta sandwich domain-containing protein n=1 Tax=Anaerobium acetethylicum TaxID=1619234 RepID=A0A1D3TZ45_9FIRM|nr:cadherin-like beta sandwich domain-containing protein [Anaerobium acetethylicum]SCP99797.1 Cadherin-like beta sandwich domain-containing protein [Anaerobium acetethylicum]